MPTLAFWNVGRKVSSASIAAFAHEHAVDILVLAENEVQKTDLSQALNSGRKRLYFIDPGQPDRIEIFSRFLTEQSILIRDGRGVSIRHYQPPLGQSILVVAVHLASKLWKKTEEQVFSATRLARIIRDAEIRVGHTRTIMIGDLNMNPFETGIVGSDGLHAISDRRVASAGKRIVHGEDCEFFYNPMWSFFGDRHFTASGTCFYNTGSEVNFFWNVFDQVLLRPTLLDYVAQDGVKVVTKVAGNSLLDRSGRPNRDEYSDHLPVVCHVDVIPESSNDDAELVGQPEGR